MHDLHGMKDTGVFHQHSNTPCTAMEYSWELHIGAKWRDISIATESTLGGNRSESTPCQTDNSCWLLAALTLVFLVISSVS
jgi:hypothetical protein